jgi:hypothetical protein
MKDQRKTFRRQTRHVDVWFSALIRAIREIRGSGQRPGCLFHGSIDFVEGFVAHACQMADFKLR